MLSRDYSVQDLCDMMGVSRSGYYKWKKHTPSAIDNKREEIIARVAEVHEQHKTHGYRWTAAFIRINFLIVISDSYAYKCFRYAALVKVDTGG